MMTKITRLKILRETKFPTQIDLANRLGISQGEVSLLERNLSSPKEDLQKKLEEVFEMPYSLLSEEIDMEQLLRGVTNDQPTA